MFQDIYPVFDSYQEDSIKDSSQESRVYNLVNDHYYSLLLRAWNILDIKVPRHLNIILNSGN